MKKIQAGLGVAVVAVLSVASFAFAEGSAPKPLQVGVGASTQTDIGGDQNHEGSKVNSSTDVNTHMEAGDQNEQKDGSMNSSDTKNSDTGDMGERDEVKGDVSASYRSATAPFSQNLLKIADKEKEIGGDIKAVADAQSASNVKTSDAIAHVEGRGGFRTFFFGADYKSIHVLKQEMIKTTAQIAQLKVLADKATDPADKVTLNAQIQVLVDQQTKIQVLITAKESTFSLFGWANKWMND
jgi:hypothetical protein